MRLMTSCIAIAVALLLAGCASPGGRLHTGAYGGVSGGAAQGR